MTRPFAQQLLRSINRLSPRQAHSPFHTVSLLWLLLAGSALLWQCAAPLQKPPATGKEPEGPQIRVCLYEGTGSGTLTFNGKFRLKLEEATYRLDESVGTMSVSFRDGGVVISSERRYFDLPAPQEIEFVPQYPGTRFLWDDVPYQGNLSILITARGMTVINSLPTENYLQGVVPFEIPTGENEYRAAVFAQTVAARSYALYRLENPVSDEYDIRADERDQIYRGLARVTSLSESAIAETRGVIMARDARPVRVQYHSTCGGPLEVSARNDSSYRGQVVYDLSGQEYNCKISPFYRWVEIRDAKTVLKNLMASGRIDSLAYQSWIDNGFEMEMDITARSGAGRVEALIIRVNGQPFAIDRDIRQILADETGKALSSSLFFLNRSPAHADTFYIVGAGYGHGRGMCQWGAIGMALKGYAYRDVLNFYYPDLSPIQYY